MGKKFSKIKEKRAVLWRLLILALPEWQYLSGGFSFLLIAAATTTWLPKLTGEVIDDIVIEKNEDLIRGSLTRLAVVSLASAVASGIRGTCFLIIMVKMNVRLRDKVYSAILCQEMDFFDATKTGDLSSRLSADCNKMSDQIGLNINVFLRSVVQAIGLLCFMVYSQWQLTVVTFLSVPLVTVVSRVYGSYYRTIAESVQDQQAACNAAAEEIIGSMRTVRSFGNEEREREEYRAKLDKLVALGFSQAYAYTGYMSFVSASPLLVTVAVLFYGGHMVMVGSLKPGELISFVFYQQSLSQALGSIGDVFTGLMQAAGAAEKVFDIMDRKPKIAPEGTLAPETLRGEIEFDNVSMVYSARAETIVLDKVSFSVAAGQVAALVGSSGSGKSSCIALLQRFYQASGGRVLLDGHPLEAYTHEYLHSRISLVAQEPVLYARSIAENIAYGFGEHLSPEELRAKVVEAAKLACCHHFISRMKLGYDTMAGEKGSHLSGGQKQRIAIARALVRDPAVLLLDEATSALDTASEASVQSAIDTSMQGRTVLVIAHRLSTVRRAHNIIVLQDGVVQQQGTHDSLIEQGGVYKTLVQRQLGPEHIDAQEMSSAQLIT
ncbi:P-loop containing nucleoside triphosphate hydrolase protein [Baffinella frigidus]|nr:P-loop containing nucleoside triphosphate hydrolase protein [Cryptophyta sp. CCMP2293]